jgi:hypothetical protein
MPESAAAANDGRLTPDRARELAKRRWQHDGQGLDEYIDRIVKRAPALTPAQRERLALLLHPGAGEHAEAAERRRRRKAAPHVKEGALARVNAAARAPLPPPEDGIARIPTTGEPERRAARGQRLAARRGDGAA